MTKSSHHNRLERHLSAKDPVKEKTGLKEIATECPAWPVAAVTFDFS